MSKKNLLLKIILPLIILVIGVIGFKSLTGLSTPPKKQAQPQRGLLVEVLTIATQPHQVTVHATGSVAPGMEISLVPEVSGKIDWLSPQLVTGGFFRKGEKLLEIDQRDYRLAVEQAQATLAQAEVALQTEEQQSKLALEEWQLLNMDDKGEPSPLVLRAPQLKKEKANLDAARAGLKKAQLNLQRTTLYAPFDCRIRTEQVDPGQYLRAGTAVATLAGTAQAEIKVPLPLSELQWLDIPRAGDTHTGSRATISLTSGSERLTWTGEIVRSAGEIDPASHMATIIVAVDTADGNRSTPQGQLDLSVGLFVDVALHGTHLPEVVSIPRSALRENDSVWLADLEDRLQIRPVHVLRREQDTLLIDEGLSAGERMILTTLDGAVTGLLLRPMAQEQTR